MLSSYGETSGFTLVSNEELALVNGGKGSSSSGGKSGSKNSSSGGKSKSSSSGSGGKKNKIPQVPPVTAGMEAPKKYEKDLGNGLKAYPIGIEKTDNSGNTIFKMEFGQSNSGKYGAIVTFPLGNK